MIAWEYPGGAELDRLVMECGGLSGRDEERIEVVQIQLADHRRHRIRAN